MFDFHLIGLRALLDMTCSAVNDYQWMYFAQGTVAAGTPTAVNTLMQRFGGKTCPVSKYIQVRAYEKCETSLVTTLKALAQHSNNPAFKGLAFELEQIDFIRLSYVSSQEDRKYVTSNSGLLFVRVHQLATMGRGCQTKPSMLAAQSFGV
jgi:hypothetical protein